VPLGGHPQDDGANAICRLPVKRPAAHVPVHAENGGNSIGELLILLLGEIRRHKRLIRATNAVPNTKVTLGEPLSYEAADSAQ
jgi:hypothetical protein